MDLYIAEKPELARAIRDALSGHESSAKGYYTKGDNLITYALGHLLELKKPDEIDPTYKSWDFKTIPFNLKEYQYKPIDTSKEAQLKVIEKLLKDSRVDRVIHCGDADDEGQILIEEILNYLNNKKPVMRVLINDLTKEAITKEIASMKPNSHFKAMSDRGFARSIADYETGLNLTRAYTCAYRQLGGDGTINVGRVMTPILGLIVARDYENSNFTSSFYYTLKATFMLNDKPLSATLELDSNTKITEEDKALEIQQKSLNQPFRLTIKTENKLQYPPLPFNLIKLQAKASSLYGFSAKKTLEITQKLRVDYQAITYNRSDCEYLPESAFRDARGILAAVGKNLPLDTSKADLSYKGRAFDDNKLSAHYGIIPTQKVFDTSKLSKEELQIYTLIARQFLMQFFKPCEYLLHILTFTHQMQKITFKTTLRQNTKLGFKEYFSDEENSESEKEQDLNLKVDSLEINALNNTLLNSQAVNIEKEKTKPKPLYTMTTLLKDLNSVAKYVKNEKIKKLLLEKDKDKKGESGGIGTPATRSDTIEKLFTQGYIAISKDKKQQITSTQKGKDLIKNCSGLLSTPDMTALWYEYQKDIEAGKRTKENFLSSVKEEIRQEIHRILKQLEQGAFNMVVQSNNSGIQCPQCKKGFLRLLKGKNGDFFGCSNYKEGCKFSCPSKRGKPDLSVKEKHKGEATKFLCPKCNNPLLKRQGTSTKTNKPYIYFTCSAYRETKCDFRCFADSKGEPKILSDK